MVKSKVIDKMNEVFQDVPYGVEHTLRVLDNAEEIMMGENIPEDQRELISVTAILHDIGAVEALSKHGSMDGHFQEIEGPAVARKILEEVGYEAQKVDRVCYIVGNHHTPSRIDGIDFQIQWEADLLENLTVMDIRKDVNKLKEFIDENFKTVKGKALACERFCNI